MRVSRFFILHIFIANGKRKLLVAWKEVRRPNKNIITPSKTDQFSLSLALPWCLGVLCADASRRLATLCVVLLQCYLLQRRNLPTASTSTCVGARRHSCLTQCLGLHLIPAPSAFFLLIYPPPLIGLLRSNLIALFLLCTEGRRLLR